MHAIHLFLIYVVFVQSQNYVQLFATPWPVVHQAPLSSTVSWSLLQFMSTGSVMPSNHLIPCHLLLLLLSIFSSITILWFFASGGQSTRASASAAVLPINSQGWFPLGLTGLISLQSKGLSRNNLKASVLQCSDLFMTQISHLYMTTG